MLMTVTVAPRVRSATAKNNAMAIAPGLIWRAIFVFIRHSLLPFPSENFGGRGKKVTGYRGSAFRQSQSVTGAADVADSEGKMLARQTRVPSSRNDYGSRIAARAASASKRACPAGHVC